MKLSKQVLLSLAAILSTSQAWPHNSDTVGKQVNTTSGLITGHAASSYPDTSEYLGVPFAQSTYRSNTYRRASFCTPKPYIAGAPIQADKQPLSCVQSPSSINYSLTQPARNIVSLSGGVFANYSGEDCLYLNVWTKYPACSKALKPIMIWFFGGGFHSGGASDPSQQGGIFASTKDVVYVNFNYRLGIFGFPGAPGMSSNLGLLDQRLVIEWVRDNALAFGGDPARITIFGHSAGGASVDYYQYAYKDDPIIAASIAGSGTTTTFGHRTPDTAVAAWDATGELMGCGNTTTSSSTAVLECMRQQNATQIFTASLKAAATVADGLSSEDQMYVGITGLYSPTVDNITVFSNYSTLGQAGAFIHRPYLTGSNSDEACFFLEIKGSDSSVGPAITEGVFTCPVNWAAIYRAQAGIPTWKYRWFGAYPNMELNVCPGMPWHGQELYEIWNSSEIASGYSATAQQIAAGSYFLDAFTTFAKNPTTGLTSKLGWPTFNSDENAVVELGLNSTMMYVANATALDEDCFTEYRFGGPAY